MISQQVPPDTLLILPTVSIGNASQRSVDLLINNFDIPFLCHLDVQDCFLPMVATDPFDAESEFLITTCSAYFCPKRKVLVFQFRSDFLNHKRVEFIDRLKRWLLATPLRQVVLLTSCWAPARNDRQLTDPGIFYLRSDNALQTDSQLKALSLLEIDQKTPLSLPGSGFAVELYESLQHSKVPLIVLLKYCDEEWYRNIVDAIEIFESLVALEFDRSEIKELKKPYTWTE